MVWHDFVHIGLLALLWVVILMNYRSNLSARKYWMLFFLVYSLTEFFGIAILLQGKSNLWLYNVSYALQFVLLLLYLLRVLNLGQEKATVWTMIGFIVSAALLINEDLNKFNSLEKVIFDVITLVLCVLYFKKVVQSESPIDLGASEFWFCSSLFIFFGISLWHNGFMGYLIENNLPIAQQLFDYYILNSYVFYGVTFFALLSNYKKK